MIGATPPRRTCPACVAEMPDLKKLYKELAPRGLEVIGVAMNNDPPNQVMAMAKERNIPYPVAVDTQGKVAKAFGVPRAGATVDEADLIAWSREHMANYKVPRSVEVVESFPLNARGKVLKYELRARSVGGA